MLRRCFLAFAVVASTLVACSSLPDLTFDDDAGGGTEGGGGEGGVDGGPDTSTCVKAGPEVCDDGLDNDCNGMADCADPACGGFGCVLPAPDSWELVAVADATQPACPLGFTGSTDLKVLNGAATHTCPCSCTGSGGSGPTCAGAATSMTTGDDPACTNAQTTATLNSNTAGVCTALPIMDLQIGGPPNSAGFAKITSPAGPATCAPNASITKTDPTNGRSCSAPTKTGMGCSGLLRCVPKATGFTMCISKAGDQVCPTGFTNKRRVAGTTATDTRACLPCTCGNAPCAGDIQLWSNAACAVKKSILTTAGNTACAAPQAGSDSNVTAKFYKSAIAGGCSVATPATLQGTLTFGGQRTICCN